MDPYLGDWLHLVLRWVHIITGIAWIGASFYFNWLEGQLNRTEGLRKGIAGNLWAVHGGGFYFIEKYQLAPEKIPEKLHWFKWEAYFTWISGFCLLVFVYYGSASVYLLDRQVADISQWQAIAISLTSLVGAWLIYHLLCRSKLCGHGAAFALTGLILTLAAAYGYGQLFSSRGAYMHVGAMLGTLMAANVFFVIIPAQKELVAAALAKRALDPALGINAGQRSLHNNYMTLPVLFIMISGHFPMTYGHAQPVLVLAALVVIGALVRHFFNLKNRGNVQQWILPLAALAMISLAMATKPAAVLSYQTQLTDAQLLNQTASIIVRRCSSCHSAEPTNKTFPVAPAGVVLDNAEQMQTWAEQIHTQVVVVKTMPLANLTAMTDDERALLGQWYRQTQKSGFKP